MGPAPLVAQAACSLGLALDRRMNTVFDPASHSLGPALDRARSHPRPHVPGPGSEQTAFRTRPPSAHPRRTPSFAASQHGQLAMSIIKDYLIPVSGLQFQDQVASRWSPQPGVMLDPSVQFGETCIHDTRIPTRATCGPGCAQPGTRARSSDEPSLCPPPRAPWDPRSIAPLRTPFPTSPAQVPSGRHFNLARLPRYLLGAHPTVRGEPAWSPRKTESNHIPQHPTHPCVLVALHKPPRARIHTTGRSPGDPPPVARRAGVSALPSTVSQ